MTGGLDFSPEAERRLNQLDKSSGELVVTILGDFHGGQDRQAAPGEEQVGPEVGG